MPFLKSLLAGLLVVVAASIVFPIFVLLGLVVYRAITPTPNSMAIGWNPVSYLEHPSVTLIAFLLICFGIGFFWEYRKLARLQD